MNKNTSYYYYKVELITSYALNSAGCISDEKSTLIVKTSSLKFALKNAITALELYQKEMTQKHFIKIAREVYEGKYQGESVLEKLSQSISDITHLINQLENTTPEELQSLLNEEDAHNTYTPNTFFTRPNIILRGGMCETTHRKIQHHHIQFTQELYEN